MLQLAIAVLALAANDCGVRGARGIVEFDVLEPPFASIKLPGNLDLSFGRYGPADQGFETMVTRGSSDRNLVWLARHGPDEADVTSWSHFQHFYPDVRPLRIPNHAAELIVDLREVKSSADPERDASEKARGSVLAGPSGKFLGGTVRICWRAFKTKRAISGVTRTPW